MRVLHVRDLGLAELPRLATGKVDYAALARLLAVALPRAAPATAPLRLAGERMPCCSVVDAVAPEDSFASLGG